MLTRLYLVRAQDKRRGRCGAWGRNMFGAGTLPNGARLVWLMSCSPQCLDGPKWSKTLDKFCDVLELEGGFSSNDVSDAGFKQRREAAEADVSRQLIQDLGQDPPVRTQRGYPIDHDAPAVSFSFRASCRPPLIPGAVTAHNASLRGISKPSMARAQTLRKNDSISPICRAGQRLCCLCSGRRYSRA